MIQLISETKLHTKWGDAVIDYYGYYVITGRKNDNYQKKLHRLIWEDWYGKPVPDDYDIHHLNGDKLDNRIQNLQCVPHKNHVRFHVSGKNNCHYGKSFSEEHKKNLSLSHNSTGYFRVYKEKSNIPQGFIWRYQCSINGSRIRISSKSLEKLEEKVKKRGLEWEQF